MADLYSGHTHPSPFNTLDGQPLHGVPYIERAKGAQLSRRGLDGIDDHVGTMGQYATRRQDQPRRNDESQSQYPWLGSGIYVRR
jgi:hypothetical protein